jgi:tetraacyldisaccharide 4'-kinase
MSPLLRFLLFPFSIIYGVVMQIRNLLYDKRIFSSFSFNIPVISIGNLTVGGTGKTPHTEYLIRLLNKKYKIATLSRGYGRKTKGFIIADDNSLATKIGDEPMQLYYKFSNIKVSVGEDRVKAIQTLLKKYTDLEVILLDDAFQHRALKPGLSILLTDYNKIFVHNHLLPTGTLREPSNGMKRADIIIVTRTPALFSPLERRRVEREIQLAPHQKIFFSYIKYGEFMPAWKEGGSVVFSKEYYFDRGYSFLFFTGIANIKPLQDFFEEKQMTTRYMEFGDHHNFTKEDINKLEINFNNITGSNKIIVTTEKDYMRLKDPALTPLLQNLPIYYLPIEIELHEPDKKIFDKMIFDYVGKSKRNDRIPEKQNQYRS